MEQPDLPSTSSELGTVANVTQITAQDNAQIHITNLVSGSGSLNFNSSSESMKQ